MEKKDIFENINNWLRYAEAKNGILISFNGVLLFSSLSLFKDFKHLPNFREYLAVFIVLILISMLINLLSFIPKTLSNTTNTDNVIYWKSIAKQDENKFKEEVEKADTVISSLNDEIIINSKIALAKFRIFNIALIFTVIGLLEMSVYSGYIIITKIFIS